MINSIIQGLFAPAQGSKGGSVVEDKRYDLVVIGGGVAGLVLSSGAAQLGARVALVERKALGGDCLWAGCVPTKRLVHTAKVASLIRRAPEFGLSTGGDLKVDFPRVMELMRQTQARIAENDDPERFRKMGIDVFFGNGRFIDHSTFEVDGRPLHARRFAIATGSSPVILPIPGLKESGPLTNETALQLKELPGAIAILGAGPIGMEFAQVFSRLGSKVTVLEKADGILPREDREVAVRLKEIIEAEGVSIELSTEVKEVKREGGRVRLRAAGPDGGKDFEADEVMIAIGRSPNVAGLDLEAAGVEYDARKGVNVNGALQTSNRRIYACGDVVGPYAFTHVAEYHAGVVLVNALFPLLKRKVDYRVVPWTIFTDPELARVGLTEEKAREEFKSTVSVFRHSMDANDRAVIEGEDKGLIKLVCDAEQHILGAHILGPNAGEMINEYVLAMKTNTPVTKISQSMHVYPTVALGLKRAADEYYREKFFGPGWFARVARWLVTRGHRGGS